MHETREKITPASSAKRSTLRMSGERKLSRPRRLKLSHLPLLSPPASYFLRLICYYSSMGILSDILDTAREIGLTLFLYYLFIIALPFYARFRARRSPAFREKRIVKYPEVVSGFYFWGIIWISAFLTLNIDIAKLLQKNFPIASYLYASMFIAYYACIFYSIYCLLALKLGALKTIKIALISFPVFRTSFQFIFLYLLGFFCSNNLPMDIFNEKITPHIKLLLFMDIFWTAPWLITFTITEDKHIWEPHKKNSDIIFS